MPLKLSYRGQTALPVEVEGLTPDWTHDKSLAEIERFEIFHGNRKLPLAEMFSISGDASDHRIELVGDLTGVHWIGAHMRSGLIHVNGHAGRHLGSELRGGEIHITGNAGGWAGCEMRAGLIQIHGNAGDVLGGAYRGSAQGMRGGTIVVDGHAGNEAGLLMKQGVLAVGGDAGEMLGYGMTGGSILVIGNSGPRPGAEMHAGEIGILGPTPPAVLSSFQFDRLAKPERFDLVLYELTKHGWKLSQTALPAELQVFVGDQIAGGNGELLLRAI
jgi:formylmethanofuran dehydrogenase subunit C